MLLGLLLCLYITPQKDLLEIIVYADSCQAAKNSPNGYTATQYDLNDDCKQDINPYMMTDLTWEECAKSDEVLCFHCFSVRIDRPIFPSDFMECDINEPFLSWVKWFVFQQTKQLTPSI